MDTPQNEFVEGGPGLGWAGLALVLLSNSPQGLFSIRDEEEADR